MAFKGRVHDAHRSPQKRQQRAPMGAGAELGYPQVKVLRPPPNNRFISPHAPNCSKTGQIPPPHEDLSPQILSAATLKPPKLNIPPPKP